MLYGATANGTNPYVAMPSDDPEVTQTSMRAETVMKEETNITGIGLFEFIE